MEAVEAYINDQEEPARSVLQALHRYLTGQAGLVAKIRYKIPFYDRHSWICYLNVRKEGGVELAFTQADQFPLSKDLLDFRGRKQVGGIVYHQVSDIDPDLLHALVMEAVVLDEERPYRGPQRKPKKKK
ncbi:MAG: DUF1801 domain-containing protein [Bacteroidetes bacterium]|nr:MAG: DUF1801 domain-containing protein [Bacteroidota bacterium]